MNCPSERQTPKKSQRTIHPFTLGANLTHVEAMGPRDSE